MLRAQRGACCTKFLVTLLALVAPSNGFRLYDEYYNSLFRPVERSYKAKVETQGAILKRHVQQLRSTENKQVDLVFLVDSSASVGGVDFREEIKFVRKLLADFTVDINTTRVAVITFSSREKVVRQVDHLSRPYAGNHKCSLLTEEVPKIKYVGGGTYTLGAFLEAQKVLRSARADAQKAVFLITDGFSNGGDPRPEARRLRQQGVKIFTFGIRNGNVRELWEMASDPRNETCYVLDSFEEFEALARRALHSDLHSGSYISQPAKKCSPLCINGGFCCHANATCTCGTHTGNYECLCKPGFYGNGLGKDGCRPCPSGTYKNHTGSGDVATCTVCPDENQETLPGATLVHECKCKRGFRNFNSTECTVFRCPDLKEPENGYFVNNQCNNVFNAACGLRCRPGYELRGSGLRICQEDGSWSGQDTLCVLRTCPALPSPKNGHMVCTTDDFRFPTVCRFTCQAGYQLLGSRKRSCLAIAFWTGIAARCREITCPPLPEIRDGSIQPTLCTDGDVPFGTTCQLSCLRGYKLRGPSAKQCTPDGTWSAVSREPNQCIDKTPPYIQCPDNIEISANPDNETTEVTWAVPVAVDNSGFIPVLTSDPAVVPPAHFPLGLTVVTYRAEDLSENVARCKFFVLITDDTPPRVDKCFSPEPVVSTGSHGNVTWEEPIFSDNSGVGLEVMSSHSLGEFPQGLTQVTYTAFDNSGNNNTCTIDVEVSRHPCHYPEPPVHGDRTCHESEEGVHCVLTCDTGYAFVVDPPPEYFCAYDNVWTPADRLPFPDCAAQQISNEVLQPASITLTGDLSCAEHKFINRVEQNIEAKVNNKLSNLCEDNVICDLEELQTTCDEHDDFNTINVVATHRRKRAARAPGRGRQQRASIKFDFTLEGTVNNTGTSQEAAKRQKELSKSMKRLLNAFQAEAKGGHFDLYLGGRWLRFSDMDFDARRQRNACPEGAILINNTCVLCPVGMFYNVVSHVCESCPKGTYQPTEGLLTCMVCPEKTSTNVDHARSENDCRAQCLPGSVSPTGLERCETCPEGSYQSKYAQVTCLPCPDGSTTLRRGARGEAHCRERCTPGQVSRTGLAPCYPCPHGTYQPDEGQKACIKCPNDVDTDQRASTSIMQCLGFQELQSDDAGSYQNQEQQVLDANECFTNPCQNGGICIPKENGLFDCNCRRGFEGVFCQTEVDQCQAQPCLNGGSCTSLPAAYLCDCPPGFQGQKCERDVDECVSSPCQNGGTCVDGANSFTCNCRNGFQGVTCENDVNDCEDQPCMNGGTCEDDVSGYRCACPGGFSGTTCEIETDECLSAPCQNGGTCVDEPSSFRCECEAGYTGTQCEQEILECASSPCQNGAKCEDLINNYLCHCTEGFTGTHCESEIDALYQLDFPTASTVNYALMPIDNPLTSLTVSFWMRSDDTDNYGTAFSYAVPNIDNALTLTDYNGFAFYVNQESVITDVFTNDGYWHHVVITWSSFRGNWKIYIDGLLNDSGFDLSTARPVPGKGTLVIGQEQDSVGGGFSTNEAFVGSITQFNMWDEELSLNTIESMRTSCAEYHGNVIAWPDVQGALRGSLGPQPSTFCQECQVPDDIEFGSVDYPSLTPGSEITFSCMRGFNVAGPATTVCLITGEYELPAPRCQRVDCGNPGTIANGYFAGWRFSFDNRVRFKCQRGYTLRGPETLYCNEYGEWQGDRPECVEITCQLPLLSANTILSTQKTSAFKPGDQAVFNCAPGHQMLTFHDSVTCQSDGTWDRSVPTCDPQTCPAPPQIPFGEPDTLNEEYNVGEIVRYMCDFGYTLNTQGSNPTGAISCLPTGDWESPEPECALVECGEPPLVAHASMDGEDRTFLSRVIYECYPGYQIQADDDSIQCLEEGEWDPEPPTCQPVDCGPPADLDNGEIQGTDYYYNAVITCSCLPGYKLVGTMRRRCNEMGMWEGPDPVCQPVDCGPLADPANGVVLALITTYPSDAIYECDEGYILEGDARRTCTEEGSWSLSEPTCTPVACEAVPDLEHGSWKGPSSFTFGARVEYECQQGYYMDGMNAMTCQSNGYWSNEVPVCLPVTCPDPAQPQYGTAVAQGLIYTSKVEYTCEPGYRLEGETIRTCEADGAWGGEEPVCVPIVCQPPPPILNGQYDYKDLKVGSIVRYTCDLGYRLQGSEVRRCQADLTLSDTAPSCVPVSCPPPSPPLHGDVTVARSILVVGSRATYSCDLGYVLVGDQVRTCRATGELSGEAPTCRPVECTKPGEIISNGRMLGTSYTFNSTISYVCDEGYRMEGEARRVCQADGQWSQPIPGCIAVECPRARIVNGSPSTFRREFGTVVTFTCRSRHRLEGSADRTCLADGSWSGEDPVCVKVVCPPPLPLENGLSRQVDETTLVFACNQGFRLEGSNTSLCSDQGLWEPGSPLCVQITCPDISTVRLENGVVIFKENFGNYGSDVQYVCNTGYSLVGASQRLCTARGEWEGDAPVCEIISCPQPEEILDGMIIGTELTFGSSIRYECNTGYTVVGASQRGCIETGQWEGRAPVCEIMSCPQPEEILDGMIIGTELTFGSSIRYECNTGYTVVGASQRGCTETGEWEGDAPVCEIISCPQPEEILDGMIIGTELTFGSSIRYECITGYTLVGTSQRGCTETGQWEGRAPVCEIVHCPRPEVIPNGQVIGRDFTFNNRIQYECNTGYTLLGVSQRECSADGEWADEAPVCQLVSCPQPENILNGAVIGTDFTYGSSIEYVCDRGYTLIGFSQRQCIENGEWDVGAPSCQIVSCPPPGDILNGVVVLTEFTYGSSVTYSCHEGYTLVGSSQRECLESGEWAGEGPVCEIVSCPQPGDILNGQVVIQSRTFGSEVTYECDEGHVRVGVASRRCKADGLWEGEKPRCEPVSCPDVNPSLENGAVVALSNTFGGQVRYACNPGFVVRGESYRECTASGEWSADEPTCVSLVCPRPPPVEHGTIIGEDYRMGRRITYSCYEGFQPVGRTVLDCLPNLMWSGDAPICERVNCPPLPPTQFGRPIGKGRRYGDGVLFLCDPGYELLGALSVRCQADGTWDTEPPECSPVNCGIPSMVENARLDLENGTLFPAEMSYVCDTGYRPQGSAEASCQKNGTWSESILVCELVKCPDILPNDLYNGAVSGRDFSYSEVIHFSCNEGFRLVGNITTTCLAEGYWSSEIPQCEMITCGEPEPIFQGTVTVEGYEYNSTATYECNIGYRLTGAEVARCLESGEWDLEFRECLLVTCGGPPETIQHGALVENNLIFIYEDQVEYQCDAGYELVGSGRLTCTADGIFAPSPPSCAKIQCPSPETPTHGAVQIINDTLIYSCVPGYELAGIPQRRCLETGQWEGVAPVCIPILCPPPPPLDNGIYNGIEFQFQSAVSYSCNPGFRLRGDRVRRCMANRAWSGADPVCERMSCGTPRPVQFATIIGEEFTYNASIAYECELGFALIGAAERTCMETGVWSGAEPYCDEITCEFPPDVLNATHDANSPSDAFFYGSLVMYMCNRGHVMTGASSVICQEDGTWSEPLPACPPVTCLPFPAPEHGQLSGNDVTFGGEIGVTCDSGYRLIGEETLTCMANGNWDWSVPACEQIQCSAPVIQHGEAVLQGKAENVPSPTVFLPGQTVDFRCLPGYRIGGSSFSTCLENGYWTNAAPVCVPVTCGTPPTISHALPPRASTYNAGDTMSYTCELGYEVEGGATLICDNDGSWAGIYPQCIDVVCDAPPPIEHASLVGRGDRGAGSMPAGGWVQYQCDEGFTFEGDHDGRLSCQRGGAWSSDAPRCVHIDCGQPPVPYFASVTTTGTTAGSVAVVTCMRGYRLPGGDSRMEVVCDVSGTWAGTDTVHCEPLDCFQPPGIANMAAMEGINTTFGTRVSYECLPGYELAGDADIECSEAGLWVRNGLHTPECVPLDCRRPETNMQIEGSEFTFNSTVTLTCLEGTRAVGSETITCMSDGRWSPAPGRCDRILCPSVPPPENGYFFTSVEESGTEVGGSLQILCQDGFSLVGDNVITCQSDGRWSSVPPSCELVRDANALCDDTVDTEHAVVPPGTHFPGDTLALSCRPGYRPEGDVTSLCQEDRTWTAPSGSCVRQSCGPPPVSNRLQVKVLGRSYLYGDRVMYMCRRGLSASRNPPTLTCTETGEWDGVAECTAQCKRPCENGGMCVMLNTCKCRPGYTGLQCQTPICILPCLNGGVCQGPYNCRCPQGYFGSRCHEARCDRPCQNGGRCLHPNRCQCFNGFKPPFCESSIFPDIEPS
ncbi:sushi, von Willebrand factor type A, EGF and pentraxin domain-containing protein 1-like isoform X2 [Littorina saxatilis]|uniref:Sushi, von Willebrand factor type A, EGF and pentraxin domain-containing protein 1-like n=1 Tax=Littorina saxatilis TaxID=31220 RepID=A0AAN9B6E3_9CAEN